MIFSDSKPAGQGSDCARQVSEPRAAEPEIADLQSRVAFQEDTLQALNGVIAGQDAKIAQLQKQVKLLNDKLNDIANSLDQGAGSGERDVPPHY